MKRLLLILLVCTLGAGCTEENPFYNSDPLLPDQCRRGGEVSETFESFERPDELDILVVVDDSGDILREQERLAMAMPGFLDELADRGLSIRLGVVPADASAEPGLAEPGTLYEGCEQNTAQFADSERPSDWKRAAACNIMIGQEGQTRQEALKVIERSVIDRPGTLEGFFRERARLLVIVLTNEDDCSGDEALPGDDSPRNECIWRKGRLTEVDALVDSIRQRAKTPEGVALAVFAGPPSDRDIEQDEQVRPVCQGTLGASYPSNRLHRAARAFGEQGYFGSLCTDDLSFGLDEVADRLVGPSRTTLCPAERLVHEPLAVSVRAGSSEPQEAPLGDGGFLYFGSTAACENGALSLAPGILAGAEAVEALYCVDE